ncbi:Macrolide export ATP-binding/permease protein MacB [Vibrio aerogenes CECT 7868]|uniref:Macrolide export ATP-binding/permease protein MacB n=1 Tax=Vibrio aerogenes CECT 7868 TaxID=1216006 RepID=A0A1M5V604_9VIBR|nr:ABC transporter permease [Vibrio aerogenes]SHH70665.1 Macrolide export ATP-binding/permease protein MacB [Vibrio aerogenes CECT 7868]
MSHLLDLKYTFRVMLRQPGFTLFTTLMMAAGLGICIYMYALIDTLIFRPLPFPQGQRMVLIAPELNGVRQGDLPLSYADFKAIQAKSRHLTETGYYYAKPVNLNLDGKAARYQANYNQSDLFHFTRTQPVKGRLFNSQDNEPGAPPVVIIGDTLWQNYFAGRQDIIGQRILIDGISTRIIGVMPPGYEFPLNVQVWLPSQLDESKFTPETAPKIYAFAKTAPGSSRAAADAELQAIMAARAEQYPEINQGHSAFTITFQESFEGEDSKVFYYMMLAGVGFVLILACCNVSNLLLARAGERTKESAIRLAHGASPLRLMSQMMYESTLICLCGGLLAILLAGWALTLTNALLPGFVPDKPPYWWQLTLNGDVLMKSFGLIVLVSLLTGGFPAWKMSRSHISDVLRDGTRGAQSRSSGRLSRILVTVEIMLSASVVCLGLLLTLIVWQARQIDYGIKPQNVYTAKVTLPSAQYQTPDKKTTFYTRLVNHLRGEQGVLQAGLISFLPGQFTWLGQIELQGQSVLKSEQSGLPQSHNVVVYPGTLSALGVKPEAGRLLTMADHAGSQRVAVVTRSFVRRFWPGESHVIGKRFRWANSKYDHHWYTVVGIVPHIIQSRPFGFRQHLPTVYRSALQAPVASFSLVAKGVTGSGLTQTLRRAVSDTDVSVSAWQIKPMAALLQRNTAGLTFMAILFNVFGLIALLLAGSGIYGVMTRTIHQRRQELAIRQAMGATHHNVIRMLMKRSLIQLGSGIVLALPVALTAGPLLIRLMGHSPVPVWLLFVLTSVGLSAVVMTATYLPARRALRLAPMDALRS